MKTTFSTNNNINQAKSSPLLSYHLLVILGLFPWLNLRLAPHPPINIEMIYCEDSLGNYQKCSPQSILNAPLCLFLNYTRIRIE
ncbi:hypothetical protein P872_12545 [Rhodonellum psychrophilum GCM71 = DSM 17998]|uniref:Uncharacterized protein n=1 Tax=Rhodonellum psychrophilum GCM71 = DSM 17998 TaxID=1123057 RepID=U5BSY2_9BACT|nr:hypothetical protein P872_12545 [Rhodonellum psychrophilum GCM71 = DSM 17998]